MGVNLKVVHSQLGQLSATNKSNLYNRFSLPKRLNMKDIASISAKKEFPSQKRNKVAPLLPISTATGFEIVRASKVCMEPLFRKPIVLKEEQKVAYNGWMLKSLYGDGKKKNVKTELKNQQK